MKKIIFLWMGILIVGCKSQPSDFMLFSKGELLPQVVYNDVELKDEADSFCSYFEQATGVHITPTLRPSSKAGSVINISLKQSGNDAGNFRIAQKGNELIIDGKDNEDIDSAIRYFFSHFVNIEPVSEGVTSINKVDKIVIPAGYRHVQQYAFEYREPYFRDNFNTEFRKWNNTQTIEENWGLWGHNIGKVIKITEPMYATVDGKKNDEQLCFSSPELEDALTGFIRNKRKENTELNKFMVMPYDGSLVCQCSKCKIAGNTEKDASPAVFSLLNKLAGKFPESEFFSTAYMTTIAPPKFKLAPNAGVMISTMNFPKGVVIEKTAKKADIEQFFAGWKAVTEKIYLWDYAVNFDNYFDAYPTVTIAQQNLKFYKNLGVTGVFMHGSEEDYSSFGSLKCYLYAQLFQNLDADITKLTKEFYIRRYPSAADLISSYYLNQEKRAFDSPKQLDIYGGIIQSEKKYLDAAAFEIFYDKLISHIKSLSVSESAAIEPLLASLTFQRLELMRTKGLGPGGYGTFQDNSVKLNPQLNELLDRLLLLSSESDIKVVNESRITITDYVNAWRRDIMPGSYKNLMYGKKLHFTGTPDEDYTDIRLLTDGAVGFTDYYNNWLLSTSKELQVELSAENLSELKYIEMGFLNDPRHNIYLPEKVVVTIGGRKYEAKLSPDNDRVISKASVKVPVMVEPADKSIYIQTVKQHDFRKKSVACDEVYFK